MPRPSPPEFRRRAVELARLREQPIARTAEELGVANATLHHWLKRADIDEGHRAKLGRGNTMDCPRSLCQGLRAWGLKAQRREQIPSASHPSPYRPCERFQPGGFPES